MPKLRKPAGFDPYGGVGKDYQPSADGNEYWAMCGKGPQGFGMYVMRQSQNGSEAATFVQYPAPLMSGRGSFSLGGNGVLYITGSNSDSDELGRAEPVAGFVPFVAGNAPPVSIVVDQTARDMAQNAAGVAANAAGRVGAAESAANSARDAASGAAKIANAALGKANEALSRPLPAPVSDDHIAQIAWSKAIDYTGTPEFVGLVKRLAQSVLIDAIEYAKTATAAQSRLRALIELVIGPR